MTLGERIRALRRGRYTQRELAERVGINLTYLSKIENDADVPGEDALRRIADALDADADELLALTGRVPPALRQRASEDSRVAQLMQRVPSLSPQDLGRVLAAAGVPRPSVLRIDATDLELAADRREFQALLPLVVQRLVIATVPEARRASFRAGEGIQLGDWDGVVETAKGNVFVPDGVSGWEVGTARRPKLKAEADLARRRVSPGELAPADTSFVFVTPRRWGDKASWAARQRRESDWASVRVLDADDLAAWLLIAPAVHVWLSTLLGKLPDGARSVDGVWQDWSEACSPPLSTGLTIGGRAEAADSVRTSLSDGQGVATIRGDSTSEALAFITAVIMETDPPLRDSVLARSVVLQTPVAWDRVAEWPSSIVLIPTFVPSDPTAAARKGHRVLIATDRQSVATGAIDLPRVRRDAARQALVEMGVRERRADELATVARRNLLSLRRKLALSPIVHRPAWAQSDTGRALLPALLAGAWRDDRDADREVLATLARMPYDEASRALTPFLIVPDPPLRRDGDAWLVSSKEDTWDLLAAIAAPSDVAILGRAVDEVLGAVDPALDLPRGDRWLAGIRGLSRPHSELLREGLADSLVLLASRGGIPGVDGQREADRAVGRLLAAANDDKTARLWSSLGDILPLLAEAAPERFLDAVDDGLAGDEPLLALLFTDSTDEGFPFAGPEHTGLLWALEGLAWSAEHLARAALQLARLAELDPGGKWHNRPIHSLREIFRSWHPQTAAIPEERFEVLDLVRSRVPAVAWELLCGLLPQPHDIAHPTHAPSRRDWRPEGDPSTTYGEIFAFADGLVGRLVTDAGQDLDRWSTLTTALDGLPPTARSMILEGLEALSYERADCSSREALANAVRRIISHHRRYRREAGRLPPEEVDRLDAVQVRIEPSGLVERHAWLFAPHPDLTTGEDLRDWRAYQEELARLRTAAAQEVHASDGIDGLIRLASAAEDPGAVGWAAASVALAETDQARILQELDSDELPRRRLAAGWTAARHVADGWEWTEAVLAANGDWDPSRKAALLLSLRPDARVMDWAARLGEAVQRTYWRDVVINVLDSADEIMRGARTLMDAGRPLAAIDLLAMGVEKLEPSASTDLIAEALEKAATGEAEPDANRAMLAYDVSRLLDHLERAPEFDRRRLAQLEFLYIILLRHGERPARVLHAELESNPSFFVEVVSMVFRAASDAPQEVSDQEGLRARLAYDLLDSWQSPPGVAGDAVDGEALRSWVTAARDQLRSADRIEIGDQRIGHVLRYVPKGRDGIWPSEVVRDLVESIASDDLETGLAIEIVNSRGVTMRSSTAGGAQEWELARGYRTDAAKLRNRWPRTARLLGRIAEGYERDAQREDESAELTEDTWR